MKIQEGFDTEELASKGLESKEPESKGLESLRFQSKGIRCVVCTGCGHCQGINKKLHIVTEHLEKKTVALHNDKHMRLITADVGTTTIAMQLHKEDGAVVDRYVTVNPQVKYGADVLSRIAASEQGIAVCEMREMVLSVLKKGISQFTKRLQPEEKLIMVVAANTTMVYLLMGWNPGELGHTPFVASHLEPVTLKIAGVKSYIFPGLSAFVGGDIVAGIHACEMLTREKPMLLIDLGTNGEMVLGSRKKLYACATAAGPAFEGGVNRGIWGADMVSLIAEMLRKQLIDESGLIVEKYFDTGVRIGNVCVTQEAVRTIQLAKAAISTGITLLCKQYGCALDAIEKVVLAGGFGYYLNPQDAADIGLIPKELVSKTVTGGNTALMGALLVGEKLFKGEEFAKIADVYKDKSFCVNIINLAENILFESNYIEALNF